MYLSLQRCFGIRTLPPPLKELQKIRHRCMLNLQTGGRSPYRFEPRLQVAEAEARDTAIHQVSRVMREASGAKAAARIVRANIVFMYTTRS